MKEYTTKEGQTILDIALQVYGTIDYLVKLCADNSLTINDDIIGGTVLVYDTDLFTLSPISNQFALTNIFISTGGPLLVNTQPPVNNLLEHSIQEHTDTEHN